MPTTDGKKYTVSYDLDLVNSSGINTKAVNSGTLILQKPETVSGRQSITFTATGVVSTIQWVRSKAKDGSGSVEVFTLDNVTTSAESTENTFASTIFVADVLTYSDYYPFGMIVPQKDKPKSEYRYGFQGQEMDNEIKGEGNSINYTFRMHDPRIGRFFAVDPLFKEYPYYTPYAFSGNRVIDKVELEGLEPADYNFADDPLAGVRIIKTVAQDLEIATFNAVTWLHAYGDPTNVTRQVRTIKEKVTREDGFTDVAEKVVPTGITDRLYGSLDVIGSILTFYGGGGTSPAVFMAKSEGGASTTNTSKELVKELKKINKNSNAAEGHFVLYQIDDADEILKIGKADAGRTTALGDTVRMRASERAAQKGNPNAKAKIIEDLGKTTTGKAKDVEAVTVKAKRASGHKLPLNKERDAKYRN